MLPPGQGIRSPPSPHPTLQRAREAALTLKASQGSVVVSAGAGSPLPRPHLPRHPET